MHINIIWDFDGTLFDTYPAITNAFQEALHQHGCEGALDWIDKLAKQSIDTCSATLAANFNIDAASFGQAFQNCYSAVLPEAQPPFPGVIDVCQAVCAAGGKNLIVTHRGSSSMHKLLDAHKMTHYFSGFLTHDDGYPKKPDPAAFEAIMQQHRLPPAETLAVGDRDIDILAGRAANLVTFLYGNQADGCSADFNISSFAELFKYLKDQSKDLMTDFH